MDETKTSRFELRIEPTLKQKALALARERGRSLGSVITELLRRWVREQEGK
jgi:predicted HicB family RNase H-like nuclease